MDQRKDWWKIMKRILIASAVLAVLAGCSSTSDPYQKRADAEQEKREKYAERAIDKAPNWMTKLPESKSAVYASATATSPDFAMADEKAKVIAFGKICMAAGGEVDKQSRVFRQDVGETSAENSEMAIRAMCRKVDVTGAELVEVKRVSEGSRFRSYVLVALPMGEANVLRREKVDEAVRKTTAGRSREAFQEMDRPVVTPQ
jgi:hypothetical protein